MQVIPLFCCYVSLLVSKHLLDIVTLYADFQPIAANADNYFSLSSILRGWNLINLIYFKALQGKCQSCENVACLFMLCKLTLTISVMQVLNVLAVVF